MIISALGERDLTPSGGMGPAEVPEVEDILAVIEAPPKKDKARRLKWAERRARYRKSVSQRAQNYLAMEARNASLGAAGQQFVLRFEKARLIHAGTENLADRIEHVSVTLGPQEGFDWITNEIGQWC